MRLARFAHAGREATGAVIDAEIADLGPVGPVSLLAAGPAAIAAAAHGATRIPLDDVRLLAPIPRPPKFLAIGLNYADHIAEAGLPTPDFPVFFNKQTTCVIGPGDPIHVPRISALVDYEGELGIVIGRRCRHVPASRAREVIAGYTIINDVTVRDWQFKAPTMTIGKSFDTHGPTGPWVVTADEISDPQDLRVRTWVNEVLLQDASTKEMIFDCAQQIETLSTACTLEPGDLIATGTPAGVGIVRKPPVWLRPGDSVRVEIDGIGSLENPVIAEPDDTAFIEAPSARTADNPEEH
jgi:2-keto-4-pentenoate hydratase/2-oxohepta-3-ene-1,7-dioic acid hydratase in catechol pathway